MLKAFFEADTLDDFIDWYDRLSLKQVQALCSHHSVYAQGVYVDGETAGALRVICSECDKDITDSPGITIGGLTVTFKDTTDDN